MHKMRMLKLPTGQSDELVYIHLLPPTKFLRWYLNEYGFLEVDFVKMRV